MATMTIEGRRCWIKTAFGESCVPALQALGVHWNDERKAWWITSAKRAAVEEIINRAGASKLNERAKAELLERDRNNILGRAKYEGNTYYLVGRGTNTRGEWIRLMFRDGTKTFFAREPAKVEITKLYEEPRTLKGLQEYAARMKREAAGGPCECWCHSSHDCTCNRGFCSLHHDGCDACGHES
jgi:hypothetical protein